MTSEKTVKPVAERLVHPVLARLNARLLCLVGCLFLIPSYAQELEFLSINNRSPLTVIFLHPTAIQNSDADADKWSWRWQLDGSSHSLIQQTDAQNLEIDGETWRFGMTAQKRLNHRWSIFAEAPIIHHSGGLFDAVIDGWHGLTQLPEGERDLQARDRFRVAYASQTQSINYSTPSTDTGDIELGIAYTLPYDHARYSIQLNAKLPTGDVQNLSGSGAFDAALTINHRRPFQLTHRKAALNLTAGMIRTGTNKIGIEQQRRMHWFANIHAGVEWWPNISPELQLRFRSASFRQSVAHLSQYSLSMDVGVQWRRPNGIWKIGFSEDPKIDSAPDVGLYLRFQRLR